MDWLKDKKNLPIVAGLLSTVLVASIVFILIQAGVIGGNSGGGGDVAYTAPPPGAMPGGPPGAPPMPGAEPGAPPAPQAPGAAPAAAPADAKPKVAAAPKVPNYRKGPDPFYYKVAKLPEDKTGFGGLGAIPGLNITTHTTDTPQPLAPLPVPNVVAQAPIDTTPRRVSGLLYSNGVYAILETNGESRTVQPGDNVDGARVISIQPDGLTLRTNDNRTVRVPLSSVQTGTGSPNPGGFNNPGGPPPGFDPNQ